jgi:hypothetical protein
MKERRPKVDHWWSASRHRNNVGQRDICEERSCAKMTWFGLQTKLRRKYEGWIHMGLGQLAHTMGQRRGG